MALIGSLSTVRTQVADQGKLRHALDYATSMLQPDSPDRIRLSAMATGETNRIDLKDGVFAIDQVYVAKPRSEGFFESHRKYLDVQVIIEGEELMEVEDIGRLAVSEAYNPEKDLIKYADSPDASVVKLRAGDVAIFNPADGHMPSLHWRGSGLVRKTVVKVPVG